MAQLPKRRETARRKGLTAYFPGTPCQNGHVEKRYTNTGICYGCKRSNMSKDRDRHPERLRQLNDQMYQKQKPQRLQQARLWSALNPARSREIKKAYRQRNLAECQAKGRAYAAEKRKDPLFRLNSNIGLGIWKCLRGQKNHRKWQSFVTFTFEDLVAHLEGLFRKGMSWENYGTVWEVDHVKPKSLCATLEETWALSNLQPLQVSRNRAKCNRWVG